GPCQSDPGADPQPPVPRWRWVLRACDELCAQRGAEPVIDLKMAHGLSPSKTGAVAGVLWGRAPVMAARRCWRARCIRLLAAAGLMFRAAAAAASVYSSKTTRLTSCR